jgi:hypothetical protein
MFVNLNGKNNVAFQGAIAVLNQKGPVCTRSLMFVRLKSPQLNSNYKESN